MDWYAQLDHSIDTVQHVLGPLSYWAGRCGAGTVEEWLLLFREAGAPGGTLQELDRAPFNPRRMHAGDIGYHAAPEEE